MDDFDQRYIAQSFARDYPAPPPEPVEAKPVAPAKEKGSRQRAQENAPGVGDAGMALMDMLAGALKGAVEQTIGLPGDIESLYRLIADGQQRIPTTEDIRKLLPPVVPQDVEVQERVRREKTVKPAEEAGMLIPVAPVGVAKGAARILKYDAKGARKP